MHKGTTMRRIHLLILAMPVLFAVAGAQCETTLPSLQGTACLSIDDVTNIPSGDATGTIEWGTYRAVSNIRTSCVQCALNTVPESECTDSTLDQTILTTFTQNGGQLTAEATDGSSMTGSINTDGTFTIGAIITPTADDGTTAGQGLILFEGAFVGNRIIVTGTMRLTVNESDGRTFDLSFTFNITYERVE